MTVDGFWFQIRTGVVPIIKEHQKFYFRDICKAKQLYHQQGKVIEEIGEMVQAMTAGKFAPKKYSVYSDIRGTFESEAADVVISSVSFLILAGRRIDYTLPTCGMDDEVVFQVQCVRTIGDDAFTKLIATVFSFFEATDRDLLQHVLARLQFNSSLIKKIQTKEKEEKKIESKKKRSTAS